MGIFSRIGQVFGGRGYSRHATAQREVSMNLLDMWKAGRPLTEVWDRTKFADEGYRRNSLMFACVCMKAASFSQPELLAYVEADDKREELPKNHTLSQILGAGLYSGYRKTGVKTKGSQTSFMQAWGVHLDVAGNAFAYIVRNSKRMPLQLNLLSRPDLVKPIPDSNGEITGYEYGTENNKRIIPAVDIIHEFVNIDPLNPYMGLSPIAVLARMGDVDNFAGDYLRAFFLNAGIPSGLLTFKTGEVPSEERDRVRRKWKETYGRHSDIGTGGWFDVGVIDADVKYQEIGSKIRMMDLEQVFGQTESRICSAFGVNPILVGAYIGLLRSTFANYGEARKSLYRDTLQPVWTSCADKLTTDLASEFGDNIVLEFDLDDIPEFQKDQTAEKQFALDAYNDGAITRAEFRRSIGHEATEADEVYKLKYSDVYEPAAGGAPAINPAKQSDEQGRIGRHEIHALVNPLQSRQLRALAENGSTAVKKKFSRLYPRLSKARRLRN